MSEVIVKVAANGDDVIWNGFGIETGGHPHFSFGSGADGDGIQYKTYLRFPNVAIPNSARILSAVLDVYASASSGDTSTPVTVYANDIGSSVAPTNSTEGEALSLTTANVAVVIGTFTSGNKYTFPNDLSTLIQEVVDRADWVEDNAIGLLAVGAVYGEYVKYAWPYDDADASKYATLTINYTDNPSVTGILMPFLSVTGTAFHTSSNSCVLPVLIVSAEGKQGSIAVCTFPSMTISAHGEIAPLGTLEQDLPALTISSSVGTHGTASLTLPKTTIASHTGILGSITFKAATLSATALHGSHGFAALFLSKPSCSADGLVGSLCDGEMYLSKLTASIVGYDIPAGALASTLPLAILRGTGYSSDRFATDVLRYSRP